MSKPRAYEWETELLTGQTVLIMANVSGKDTPWSSSAMSPPEYRDVEIQVLAAYPMGPGFLDITDEVTEDFIEEMRVKAIEIEDDNLAAEYDRAMHNYPEDV
jgi:hypothetical protein